MDNRIAAVCSVRGGMIVRIRHDPEKAEALKAAGLSEYRFGRGAPLCMECDWGSQRDTARGDVGGEREARVADP
jgi:hypothetical protein